ADIIVNTDADNQYSAECISDLIRPILSGKAEIVVGVRPIDDIEHFSFIKKLLQKLGSWAVRLASNTDIPDTTSGFRAFSREAAKKLNVFSNYTYTLETIIQAGQKNIMMSWVPVRTNEYLRPSRLIKSIPIYIFRSISTIIRIFVVYRPFRFFILIGMGLFSIGFLIGFRFLWYYLAGEGRGHVQSLILSSILIGIGFQTILIAFIADLLNVNRKLLEDLQYKFRKNKLDNN
ncbi:MAG: glycosyltransferase family 2 protein, partial [Desulfobacterales bacterium]|nr:glycosyltransferase family 2 protein [Desulfobacterales bacterium]